MKTCCDLKHNNFIVVSIFCKSVKNFFWTHTLSQTLTSIFKLIEKKTIFSFWLDFAFVHMCKYLPKVFRTESSHLIWFIKVHRSTMIDNERQKIDDLDAGIDMIHLKIKNFFGSILVLKSLTGIVFFPLRDNFASAFV